MGSMRASRSVFVLCTAAVLGLGGPARADAIVYVPRDYATIQAAVDASVAEGTIVVDAGTYRESVVVSGAARQGLQIYASGATLIGTGIAPALTVSNTRGVGVHGLAVESSGDGVVVSASVDIAVDGVQVENVAGAGIRVVDSRIVDLETNTILGAGGAGVRVDDTSHFTMYDNVVSGTGGAGVEVSGSRDVSVCTNAISDCGGSGVVCTESSDVVADENTIEDVSVHAIEIAGTAGVAVFNNSLGSPDPATTVGGDGVHIETSSEIEVASNVIDGTTGQGVSVTGSGAMIQTNEIADAGGTAISVTGGGDYALVDDNTIVCPGATGVLVEGASITVDANRISRPGYDGIAAHGGNSEIGRNSVSHAANDGVCVTNGATDAGVTLQQNVVTRPGDDGVDLGATSNSEILGNTITRARGNGFELMTGAGNTFDANHAKDSRKFDLFEAEDPAANVVAKTNKFKKTNKRGKHHPHL